MSNLMIDVNASNEKLRDRAVRITVELTGATNTAAETALRETGCMDAMPAMRCRTTGNGRTAVQTVQ